MINGVERMTKAEILQKYLPCHTTYGDFDLCVECPYNPNPGKIWEYGCAHGQDKMINEAIALLKENEIEQEPRVLALEETDICEDGWYWIEYQTIYQTSGIYHLRCHAIGRGRYDFDQPHAYFPLESDDYGQDWRCWSARPSEEQRQKVRWE